MHHTIREVHAVEMQERASLTGARSLTEPLPTGGLDGANAKLLWVPRENPAYLSKLQALGDQSLFLLYHVILYQNFVQSLTKT